MFEAIDEENSHGFCGWLVIHMYHYTKGLNGEFYQCRGWALHD